MTEIDSGIMSMLELASKAILALLMIAKMTTNSLKILIETLAMASMLE